MAREMKDSGIQWLGAIPMDWEIGLLKRYCLCKTGSTPSTNNPEWFDGKIKWFTPGDFSDRYILSESNRTLSVKAKLDNVITIIPANTVLLVGIGATAGKIGLSKEECSCNQQITALITNKILPQYLMYWMIVNTTHLRETVMYTTLPIINNQTIGNYPIICPAPNEQKKISDHLDKKCAEIDSLVTGIQLQISILEDYKKSVITEAVTKGLNPDVEMKDSGIEWIGEIPKRWNVHPIYFYFGERKHKNLLGNEDNLLSLSYGNIIRKDINTNGGLLPDTFNTYNIVEKNDIIIRPTDLQNDKRSLRTGIVKEHGIITSAYIALKSIKNVNEIYFHYLLHSYDIKKVFYNMGNGVRQGLNFSEFSKLMVLQPSIDEQNQIVKYLDQKCAEIDKTIKEKNEQLDVLKQYKKSLIYEYVTGKKEVPNNNG